MFFIPGYILSLPYGVNSLGILLVPRFHLLCLILGTVKPTIQANAGSWALEAWRPGNQGLHKALSVTSTSLPHCFWNFFQGRIPTPPWTALQLTRSRLCFTNGDLDMGFSSFLFPGSHTAIDSMGIKQEKKASQSGIFPSLYFPSKCEFHGWALPGQPAGV